MGWKVDIVSVHLLRYSEGDKAVEMELEDCPDTLGELGWIIYTPENWVWNEKNDDPLSSGKISEIISRIELAFWKMDMPIREII